MNRIKKHRWVAVLIALGVTTSAVGGYAWYEKPAGVAAGPAIEVRRGNLTESAAASGKIEPDVQVEVKSRASGQVVDVSVKEGDHVEAGQLLVQLDTIDTDRTLTEAKVARDRVKADVAAAEASVMAAEMDRKNVEATRDVAKKSADLGLGSTDDARNAGHAADVAGATVLQRKAQLTSAKAQLAAAELTVQEAETRLKETKIYAPMAGTVLDIAVEKGTLVSSALTNVSGGSVVMTLADLANLHIVGAVDEAQIGRVAPQQRVDIRVDAYGERVFSGVVDRVSPLGKDTSNVVTFDVDIRVTDKDSSLLKSGMSADVEIVTSEQKDVVLVPLVAIRSDKKRRFVQLTSGEQRTIETGATDGNQMVVLKGLDGGDSVVANTTAPTAPKADSQQKSGGQNAMRGMGMSAGAPSKGGR
jgi:HlyD family secretion protein